MGQEEEARQLEQERKDRENHVRESYKNQLLLRISINRGTFKRRTFRKSSKHPYHGGPMQHGATVFVSPNPERPESNMIHYIPPTIAGEQRESTEGLPNFGVLHKAFRKKSTAGNEPGSPHGASQVVPRDTEIESSNSFETQSINPNPEGIFEWIGILKDISDEDLKVIAGTDAALFILFNRYAAIFFLCVTLFNSFVFLPMYLTG